MFINLELKCGMLFAKTKLGNVPKKKPLIVIIASNWLLELAAAKYAGERVMQGSRPVLKPKNRVWFLWPIRRSSLVGRCETGARNFAKKFGRRREKMRSIPAEMMATPRNMASQELRLSWI